ncbi:hypothetical protein Tco_0829827 [Tanacetum coccineum]
MQCGGRIIMVAAAVKLPEWRVAAMENLDGYRDQDMGDIILGEPFCKASCVEARRVDRLITIHNGSENVTYQMASSHPRFKHISNAQCNKIKLLLKDLAAKEIDEIILINSENIEKVMADIQIKTTMEEFATNDKANYYSGIASIMVNDKRSYDLKGKFLDDLRDNAFSGTNGEDAVEHIEYFLKIVDPINLPNVNYERLRIFVFLISLVRKARKWFDEFKGSITSWVDLTNNGQEGVDDEEFSDVEKANNDDEQETTEIFRIETNLFDYETPLADMNLKEEALKQKAIYETSWGDESQSVMNLCAWLKKSFGNIHELDYELLIKLEDYWWKVNDHERSPFSN